MPIRDHQPALIHETFTTTRQLFSANKRTYRFFTSLGKRNETMSLSIFFATFRNCKQSEPDTRRIFVPLTTPINTPISMIIMREFETFFTQFITRSAADDADHINWRLFSIRVRLNVWFTAIGVSYVPYEKVHKSSFATRLFRDALIERERDAIMIYDRRHTNIYTYILVLTIYSGFSQLNSQYQMYRCVQLG